MIKHIFLLKVLNVYLKLILSYDNIMLYIIMKIFNMYIIYHNEVIMTTMSKSMRFLKWNMGIKAYLVSSIFIMLEDYFWIILI